MFNNTTTELNAGTGGSVMDESLVTHVAQDGTETVTHRTRVVPGADDGNVLRTLPVPLGTSAPALPMLDVDVVRKLEGIQSTLNDIRELLARIVS